MTKLSSLQVLEFATIENISVRNGYVFYGHTSRIGNNDKLPNIVTGSSYEKGNLVYDMSKIVVKGTIIGSPVFESLEIVYNYLTCLIPGFYPPIGGRWSVDQDYYSLDDVLSETSISKVLGTGLGVIESYQVSDVCRSGVCGLGFALDVIRDSVGDIDYSPLEVLRLINFSSMLKGYTFPLTTIGSGLYIENFDWKKQFGIETINGSNTFPFLGWGGSRIGALKPQNFQYLQNSLYSYPSFYLNNSKDYNPIGLIYPGQLVQMNSFPINTSERQVTLKERNDRTYQIPINNKFQETKKVGILPYQEGRGVYDFLTRDIIYNERTGLPNFANIEASIGPEGAVAGRNVSLWGMAVSDTWSKSLNMNNIVNGSTTPKDINSRNAPLCYISSDEDNVENSLPWSPLLCYGASNGSNCNIIREGVTTGLISGAYPVYKGGWSSSWSGSFTIFTINNGIIPKDQYYYSTDFWNPDIKDPSIPQLDSTGNDFPIQPNPPYRIKGGRIVLFKGQTIKAGSYIYATMRMVGNVTIPQFYPPGAKEIILEEGERDNILPDVYSKFQANQGSLIVMVSTDGETPPTPPSNAVPVGITLEDIVGWGTQESFDNDIQFNIEYISKYGGLYEEDLRITQAKIDPENVCQIQAREILFRLFPMTPQLNTNAISTHMVNAIFASYPAPFNIAFGDFNNINAPTLFPTVCPIFQRVKSSYYAPIGDGSFSSVAGDYINGWGFSEMEQWTDYPTNI